MENNNTEVLSLIGKTVRSADPNAKPFCMVLGHVVMLVPILIVMLLSLWILPKCRKHNLKNSVTIFV